MSGTSRPSTRSCARCCTATQVGDYLEIDRKQSLEREALNARGPHAINPHAGVYHWFVEYVVMPAMEARTIRSWHYTRLTDAEVALVRSAGVFASTLQTLRRRLDAQISATLLTADPADRLFAGSPFHDEETGGKRSGMFWMTSHPLPPEHGGVEPLLGNWGGESVYFSLNDATLQRQVAAIGKPRVIELAVPLSATTHAYSSAKAVVATFAKTLGFEPDAGAFDLYVTTDLGPEAVIAIHTEGEAEFVDLGRGFPKDYHGRSV